MNIEKMLWDEFELKSEEIKIHQVNLCEKDKKVQIELLVKEIMPGEKQDMVKDFFCDIIKTDFEISIKQIKNHCACDIIAKKVKDFITRESSFLRSTKGEGEISVEQFEDKFLVIYSIGERFAGYFKTSLEKELTKYLYRCFLQEIEVQTVVISEFESTAKTASSVQEKPVEILLSEIEPLIGAKVDLAPAFISAVDREAKFVVVCGKVTNLKRIQIKNPRPNKNDHFYVFTLEDVSGSITCKIFQAKKYNKICSELDGAEIIISGSSENNSFSKDVEIVVKAISACKIPEDIEDPRSKSKAVPEEYNLIFPEEIEVFTQENIFESKRESVSQRVKEKRIVCFDLETTGLDSKLETIIEIGAVEIVDGVIIRKFSTLVDPLRSLPPIITQITGITDEDVAGQPTIDEVFPDFFKFCDGAVLCGHNLKGFDMKFINEEAAREGYIFHNELWDTLDIARMLVKNVKNHKLGTLCEHFGIDLTNAHRAYHDAIATAQLLIKIY
ncbi:MAG: exonuclease domain-containing protein [Bacillota bacterium]